MPSDPGVSPTNVPVAGVRPGASPRYTLYFVAPGDRVDQWSWMSSVSGPGRAYKVVGVAGGAGGLGSFGSGVVATAAGGQQSREGEQVQAFAHVWGTRAAMGKSGRSRKITRVRYDVAVA